MTLRFSILTVIMTLLALTGQAASFTVSAPQSVAAGDKFPVIYRLDGSEGQNFNAPHIQGCKYITGPNISQVQSYEIVNGRSSSMTRTEYTFIYRAEAPGSFTIPAATVVAGGKTLSTRPLKLTVGGAGSSQQPGTPSGGPAQFDDIDSQTADRAVNGSDVFIRIILNKSRAYEQEAIDCTIKLYTTYNISSFLATKQPSFDGFLIQEMNITQPTGQMESYNGRNYMTAVLKKCIIFPQKSGKLTINSGNYDLEVIQFDHVNMNQMFTVRDPKRRKIQVTSNTASIEIDPLPEPKPAGFSGAVGTFKVATRLVGNTFRTNEPATFIYTITGAGNIKYLTEPELNFPSEFEQYSPSSDIKADVTGNTVSGTMTIDYTFVPQSVGTFTIPAETFVYFDPSTRQYVTLRTQPHTVSVAKGSATPASKLKVEQRMTDINGIHPGDTSLSLNHRPAVFSWWYWLIYILVAAGAAAVISIYRRNIKRAADVVGMKRAKAGKVARRRLRAAERFLGAGNSDRFYEEMLRAMWGYLSDKLQIPVSQLSRDNISGRLEAWGAETALIDRVISILDDCEMARYTPDAPARMSDVYQAGAEVIDAMESRKVSPSTSDAK